MSFANTLDEGDKTMAQTYEEYIAGYNGPKAPLNRKEWEAAPDHIKRAYDSVNSPKHYTTHPSGIECIEITRHMGFNLGNVIKYVWRADQKGGIEDLKKARWYLDDEIKKIEQGRNR
jgi:hypothetical protein